jgi:hypothetical protein
LSQTNSGRNLSTAQHVLLYEFILVLGQKTNMYRVWQKKLETLLCEIAGSYGGEYEI